MKRLVAYIDYAPFPVVLELRHALGDDFKPSALPFVSPPIETQAELEQRLSHLGRLDECYPGSEVLVQDATLNQFISVETAVDCVKHHDAWMQLLTDLKMDEDGVLVEELELDRCWAVLVELKVGGIEPGAVFLVDKATRKVFVRRYVDLMHLFH